MPYIQVNYCAYSPDIHTKLMCFLALYPSELLCLLSRYSHKINVLSCLTSKWINVLTLQISTWNKCTYFLTWSPGQYYTHRNCAFSEIQCNFNLLTWYPWGVVSTCSPDIHDLLYQLAHVISMTCCIRLLTWYPWCVVSAWSADILTSMMRCISLLNAHLITMMRCISLLIAHLISMMRYINLLTWYLWCVVLNCSPDIHDALY